MVLVILSLLVGGILSGQALIKATELRSVQQQANEFSIALNLFNDQYMDLPGDLSNAQQYWPDDSQYVGFTTANGDGNGRIGGTGPSQGESDNAWEQLSLAGLISGRYDGDSFAVPGVSRPASKITPAAFWIGHTYHDPPTIIPLHNYVGNHIQLSTVYMTRLGGTILSPRDAYSIDAKTDDGKPNTGSILGNVGGPDFANCLNATSDEYKLEVNEVHCVLNFTF